MTKRKLDPAAGVDSAAPPKRARVQPSGAVQDETSEPMDIDAGQRVSSREKKKRGEKPTLEGGGGGERKRMAHKVRKLVPPRPFPTVPVSVSVTGPRSAHTEGKNHICITRRTNLAAYLRRCKDVFLKDGYKTLHLSAMGAAIPHLLQLALSLPPILPFPQDEIRTEILTGTVEVEDELIPDDDDEDISYRKRGKSTISIVLQVGDGVDEPAPGPPQGARRKNNLGRAASASGAGHSTTRGKGPDRGAQAPEKIIIREDELDES